MQILDMAAGAGRYVLETMRALPDLPITTTLRDNRPENVAAARKLADEWQLVGVTAEVGDAFAPNEFTATIGIVSGLYELFPSNDQVLQSLGALATSLAGGGYLIYTNQPWHPQLEFIARVLRNREGQPWIMRRRTTAEMDELVGLAGFEKLGMAIDRWGMFTVSIARRCLERAEAL